jgi:DNA-binding NarL/FixJ family response regulator
MMMQQSRVILADKNPNMLGGLCRLIENEVQTILMVSDERSLYHALDCQNPDVVVVDQWLSNSGETNIALALKREFPKLKIIILGLDDEKAVIDHVVAAGAEGFVLKRRVVIDLIPALREVIEGRKYVSPDTNGLS